MFSLGFSLTSTTALGRARFSPLALFTAGEQGFIYDPSDFERYMDPGTDRSQGLGDCPAVRPLPDPAWDLRNDPAGPALRLGRGKQCAGFDPINGG